MHYRCKVRHAFDIPELDFELLKIVTPAQLPRKMFLYQSNIDHLQIQELFGIGYGNPENVYKKHLDPRCRIITRISDKIWDCEKWLKEDLSRGVSREMYYKRLLLESDKSEEITNYLGYTRINTSVSIFVDASFKHRGSGSPFLTSDGRVVGMLTHGFPVFFFHLPLFIQCNFPKDKTFECLLRLDLVFAHINERDADLARELFG